MPNIAKRPLGITALGIFFTFGMLASGLSVISLLTPGGLLGHMWCLNPRAHEAFAGLGAWAPILLSTVSVACAMTAVGFFCGRRWGYVLGIGLLVVDLIGDATNAVLGIDTRAAIGIPIVVLLLLYLFSSRVRGFFGSRRPLGARPSRSHEET